MEPSCTYCGYVGPVERDHVISAAYLGHRTFDSNHQWLVPACETCNKLAGSKVFFSIAGKAEYLAARYKRHFAKVLDTPFWTEEELNDMDYNFRVMIEGSMLANSILSRRLRHLEVISSYPQDFARPKWVGQLMREWEELQTRTKKKKRKRSN